LEEAKTQDMRLIKVRVRVRVTRLLVTSISFISKTIIITLTLTLTLTLKVMIWDDHQNKCIGELLFKNEGKLEVRVRVREF
jgi:hypothetical protein